MSPRHAVWGHLGSIPFNFTLRFVVHEGTLVARQFTGSMLLDKAEGSGFDGWDIVVGVLDSDFHTPLSSQG